MYDMLKRGISLGRVNVPDAQAQRNLFRLRSLGYVTKDIVPVVTDAGRAAAEAATWKPGNRPPETDEQKVSRTLRKMNAAMNAFFFGTRVKGRP
jgi:hypothetical protein